MNELIFMKLKKKKINEAQNNLNKREYEREKIKFENKEQKKKKQKIFNEKIAELEKITNKVVMDKHINLYLHMEMDRL